MKKIIRPLNLHDSVPFETERFGAEPCSVVAGEYALWRTEVLNGFIRQEASCKPGGLRHLGWEGLEPKKTPLASTILPCFPEVGRGRYIDRLSNPRKCMTVIRGCIATGHTYSPFFSN